MQHAPSDLHETALCYYAGYTFKYFTLKIGELLFYNIGVRHAIIHIMNSILNFLLYSLLVEKARLSFANWFEQ